jgi:hypothetical protein
MMTRAELEGRIWAITGRDLTGTMVDAILDACEEYAADRQEHEPRMVFHRVSGTDLVPIIGLLADALLSEPEVDEPGPPALELVRGAA